MAAREMPDRAALLKLLTYDADTGKLFWKERPVHVFHSGNTSKEHNAKTWNNGFRRLWLANGKRDAAIINAARRGDLETVLARVKEMGGVRGGLGIARSIIKAAQKLNDGELYT